MQFKIDHHSHIPFHIQVEKLLRELITLPEYYDGKLLPNEVELAKLLGISRSTVRHAINKLVYDGLLERKKGIGTKVLHKTVSTNLDSWVSFSKEMIQKGVQFKNYEIKTKFVEANEEISRFFNIKEKKLVLKLCRLRGNDEIPTVYFISYFHPRIGLKGNEDFSQPLYKMLEKDYSTIAVLSKEEISIQYADDLIAKKLNIKKGDPILFRKRFVYDPGNRPIELNLGYYRADSFTYSIEIKRQEF